MKRVKFLKPDTFEITFEITFESNAKFIISIKYYIFAFYDIIGKPN